MEQSGRDPVNLERSVNYGEIDVNLVMSVKCSRGKRERERSGCFEPSLKDKESPSPRRNSLRYILTQTLRPRGLFAQSRKNRVYFEGRKRGLISSSRRAIVDRLTRAGFRARSDETFATPSAESGEIIFTGKKFVEVG